METAKIIMLAGFALICVWGLVWVPILTTKYLWPKPDAPKWFWYGGWVCFWIGVVLMFGARFYLIACGAA